MTACIRLLNQMPRSIEMELNEIGQCMISGNSGPREHAPMSAVRSNSENIYSIRVLPPVTQRRPQAMNARRLSGNGRRVPAMYTGRNQLVVATQPGGMLRWQGDGGRIERYGTS